jgi:hypothetical protein
VQRAGLTRASSRSSRRSATTSRQLGHPDVSHQRQKRASSGSPSHEWLCTPSAARTPRLLIADQDGSQRRCAYNRLIETAARCCGYAVTSERSDGLAPEPPADLRQQRWSGFRTRCRPVGSRRGVARKRAER